LKPVHLTVLRGKFSIVYHARHKASGQEVAIKCIDRDSTTPDELVHEAMLIQMVEEHPGIIKILDVYEDPQKYYLVME
jgi:serine/threonine protein kinase